MGRRRSEYVTETMRALGQPVRVAIAGAGDNASASISGRRGARSSLLAGLSVRFAQLMTTAMSSNVAYAASNTDRSSHSWPFMGSLTSTRFGVTPIRRTACSFRV